MLTNNPNKIHQDLKRFRDEIDEIDIQLAKLLNDRAKLVYEVGEYKRQNQMQIYDPKREQEIRIKIRSRSKESDILTATELERFFMGIIDHCRFFESVHVRRTEAKLNYSNCHINCLSKVKVGIRGFGLLGSSLYLGLRDQFPHWEFFVFDPAIEMNDFELWKKENLYENISLIRSAAEFSGEIIFLGAPIKINAELINEKYLKDTLVFDLGSTKSYIEKNNHNQNIVFIGGHPLAGKESTGYKNADPTLFFNKTFCLSRGKNELDLKVKSTCTVLIKAMGAIPHWIDAESHDEMMAYSSHVPQLISTALSNVFFENELEKNILMFPNFSREIIRIGGSSYSMWESIIETNKDPIKKVLKQFNEKLKKIESSIDDKEKMQELFKNANEFYRHFINLK